jgi:hypothetical protein
MRDGDRPALSLFERRRAREERSRVSIRPEPLEREPELHALELPVVLGRGRLAAELAADAMQLGRLLPDPVEERPLDEQVVRSLVIGRYTALVAPPQLRGRPVRLERRGLLVRRPRAVAAGESDVLTRARGVDEQLGGRRLRLVRRVEDPEESQESPSASSCERSIAAWIAFRNAARTPARSSSRIARIVVPPGEVTISRSSTGCMCSSR